MSAPAVVYSRALIARVGIKASQNGKFPANY